MFQYFERARFEYFPENAGTPYEVQLVLLGAAILSRFGVDWQAQPKVGGAPPGVATRSTNFAFTADHSMAVVPRGCVPDPASCCVWRTRCPPADGGTRDS